MNQKDFHKVCPQPIARERKTKNKASGCSLYPGMRAVVIWYTGNGIIRRERLSGSVKVDSIIKPASLLSDKLAVLASVTPRRRV